MGKKTRKAIFPIIGIGSWWWLIFFITSSMTADPAMDACKQEIQKIDTEVQKLEVQKKKHIELARKYQTEGDEWQYNTGRIDDAHQAWAKADRERAQAIEYQRQIDILLDQKQRLYQYYPLLRAE